MVDAEENGDVRKLQESVDLSTLKQAATTQSRIDRWTQKLLDFSARNRLLNIPRTSRQVIRLMCSSVGDLEDKIAANKTITIRSISDSMGEKALDDLLNGRMTKDQCRSIVDAELSHQRLCVMMPPREVHRRLTDLLHDARTELEESGVNTLFLTVGELQWTEPGGGGEPKVNFWRTMLTSIAQAGVMPGAGPVADQSADEAPVQIREGRTLVCSSEALRKEAQDWSRKFAPQATNDVRVLLCDSKCQDRELCGKRTFRHLGAFRSVRDEKK